MLIDPLAVFFKPALEGQPPLVLSATHVEIKLLGPLARVAVTRTFDNTTDALVEAVLTLPPVAAGEVVHGLTVRLGGVDYAARAQSRRKGQRAYDAALADGRRAILHERLAGEVQVVSIAGIEAGANVEVRVESVHPLYLHPDGSASLQVALTADPALTHRRLNEADAPVTTRERHAATLRVQAADVDIVVSGHETLLGLDLPTPIDCVAPVELHITPHVAGGLDQASDEAGGWSATYRPAPYAPDAPSAGRISGRHETGAGAIQVEAPNPDPETPARSPDVRAVTAFAAACLAGAAGDAALLRAANVLEAGSALVFVGPEGELPDQIPTLRKVALPGDGPTVTPYAPPPPVLEPMEAPPEPTAETDPRPHPDPVYRQVPGAPNPRAGWLKGGRALLAILPVAVALVWIVSVPTSPPGLPLGAVIAVFVAASLVNAVLHWPSRDAPGARRRLGWLALLAAPVAASFLGGPFGLLPDDLTEARTRLALFFQAGCMIASAVLPLGLLYGMRGARRLTLDIGGLGILAAFLSVSVSVITLLPGD